ncbi:pre-60S ribosomal particles component [Tyrophagus putrescentiae]|nr:pre-60S ribosomal particles component [Tyrophagus putrescentiae]
MATTTATNPGFAFVVNSLLKKQQKNIKNKLEEVGTSTNKRAKVLEQFDEEGLLKKVNEKGNKVTKKETKNAETKKWKVLSDDFMSGSKFKDWDKESEDDSD